MKQREWSPFCFPLLLFSSPFGGGIMQVKCAPTWWKGYRKESSLCINRTGTIALPNKGHGYLHELATLVLHTTVNYGPFIFTLMANGGGDAENSRFSRSHSGKSGKETMQNCTHPLFTTETATLGTMWKIWRKSRLPRSLELVKWDSCGKYYCYDGRKVLYGRSFYEENSSEPDLSHYTEWKFRLYSHLFCAFQYSRSFLI